MFPVVSTLDGASPAPGLPRSQLAAIEICLVDLASTQLESTRLPELTVRRVAADAAAIIHAGVPSSPPRSIGQFAEGTCSSRSDGRAGISIELAWRRGGQAKNARVTIVLADTPPPGGRGPSITEASALLGTGRCSYESRWTPRVPVVIGAGQSALRRAVQTTIRRLWDANPNGTHVICSRGHEPPGWGEIEYFYDPEGAAARRVEYSFDNSGRRARPLCAHLGVVEHPSDRRWWSAPLDPDGLSRIGIVAGGDEFELELLTSRRGRHAGVVPAGDELALEAGSTTVLLGAASPAAPVPGENTVGSLVRRSLGPVTTWSTEYDITPHLDLLAATPITSVRSTGALDLSLVIDSSTAEALRAAAACMSQD